MTNTHYEEAYTLLAEQFRSGFRSFLRDVGKLEGGRRLIKQSGIQQRFEAAELFRIKHLARELFAYMQYRMELELEDMPPGSYPDDADSFHFYYEFLRAGGQAIFGVEIGEHALIGDFDSPMAFHTWKITTANQSPKASVGELAAVTDDIKRISPSTRINTPVVKLRTEKNTPPVRLVHDRSDTRSDADNASAQPETRP